ncbi:MAG: DUF4190 domain-containing protein [Pyrinomonadaceae bacterium]|nr:DUF4190 domain-containing protein [Pyrinomonadaceae bacterium]
MTRTCPNCNQTNPPDAAFCLNCAASLGPVVGAPAFQQQDPFSGTARPHVGASPQQFGGQHFGAQAGNTASGASQKAIAALVLAIIGLLCCGGFTGIPAAIVGWMELDAIKNGRSSAAGKWMAQAGLWGGIGVTVIHGVVWILYLLMGMMASSNPYGY